MKPNSIAIILCLSVMLIFLFYIGAEFSNRGDYQFHYEKSRYFFENLRIDYAPLGHILGFPFSWHPNLFFIYVLILTAFVTPMLLFLINKKWQTVLFYFATQYFWFSLSTISQTLAGIFLTAMLLTKNDYLRFVFFILGIISHSQGFVLLGLAWMAIKLFETDWRNIFLGCSTLSIIAPKEIVKSVSTPIAGNDKFGVSIATIGNFFVKVMPFPFLITGLYYLFKTKNYLPIALSSMVAIGSILSSSRALFIIPLLIIPYAASYCVEQKMKHQLIMYGVAFLLIAFQAYSWWLIKVC